MIDSPSLSRVFWELGKLGVPYETAVPLFSEAVLAAKGFRPGSVPVPGTQKVLCWNPGFSGEGWYCIEDVPKEDNQWK
jgi:hypothetical protein